MSSENLHVDLERIKFYLTEVINPDVLGLLILKNDLYYIINSSTRIVRNFDL